MKNRLSRKSSEELAKLTLQDAYEMGYEDGKSSMSVEGETIEHEGKVLRKVNREACEGDFIRMIAETDSAVIRKGEIYGPVVDSNYVKGADGMYWEVYREGYNRTPSTVEVFEVVSDSPPQIEKTANQQRAELIKIAEEFIWSNLKGQHFLDDGTSISFSNTNGYRDYHDIDFVVNKEKQTVVALIKYTGGKVIKRGIAKCMPGDVFNEWIGKAIALGRALMIDIPVEFLEAVQPTINIGQVVSLKKYPSERFEVMTHKKENKWNLNNLYEDEQGWDFEENLLIIDDTNAIYQVGE